MQCTRNTELQPSEDVRVYFARGNPCFRLDSPIYPEIILLTYFVQDAMDFSSLKAHDKRTLTAPILVQHFRIYT